jgi:hypothetical protein
MLNQQSVLRSVIVLLFVFSGAPLPGQTNIPAVFLPEDAVGNPPLHELTVGRQPHIATNGTTFIVTSTYVPPVSSVAQMFMAAVDESGQPLLGASQQFSGRGSATCVASNGDQYLATWSHAGNTVAVRIDSAGNFLDSHTLHEPTYFDTTRTVDGFAPLAWNGNEYVVLTLAGDPFGGRHWIATRVDSSGTVIENDIPFGGVPYGSVAAIAARSGVSLVLIPQGASTDVRTLSGDLVSPVVQLPGDFDAVTDGADGFLAVSRDNSELAGQHFDTSGRPDSPPFIIDHGEFNHASVTSSGASYVATWSDFSSGIKAIRLTGDGRALDSHVTILPRGGWPEIASNGRSSLVALTPDENTSTRVAQVRDDASATNPFRGFSDQINPLVTWDGNEPHVTWNDGAILDKPIGSPQSTEIEKGAMLVAVASSKTSKLYLALDAQGLKALTPNGVGVQLDDNPLDFGALYRVIPVSDGFMAVWLRNSSNDSGIFAARISSDGTLLDPPHRIASGASDLAIGASETSVLVAYNDGWGIVRGLLLTPQGLLTTDDITVPQDLPHSLSIASDGTNFLVTWLNQNAQQSNDYVGGQLIAADGHTLGPKRGFTAGNDAKSKLTAFWSGSNYLILWSRSTNFATADLWAARVTTNGQLIDYPAVHIGPLNGQLNGAAIGPAGQLAVAYMRHDGGAAGSQRAYARILVFTRRRLATHR